MPVRATTFESAISSSADVFAIWGVPELAVLAMLTFAVAVVLARYAAFLSVGRLTSGARVGLGSSLVFDPDPKSTQILKSDR